MNALYIMIGFIPISWYTHRRKWGLISAVTGLIGVFISLWYVVCAMGYLTPTSTSDTLNIGSSGAYILYSGRSVALRSEFIVDSDTDERVLEDWLTSQISPVYLEIKSGTDIPYHRNLGNPSIKSDFITAKQLLDIHKDWKETGNMPDETRHYQLGFLYLNFTSP